MKASELIERLEELKEKHGDLEVGVWEEHFRSYNTLTGNIDIEDNDNLDGEDEFGTAPELGNKFIGL